MSYAIQSREGLEQNKFYVEDTPIHDWYRFVLSYPPHLVRDYLNKFKITQEHCVLDPFCGTGTTLVECMKHGIDSVGIEANPIAHLAATTKTSWDVDTKGIRKHAAIIAKKAEGRIKQYGNNLRVLTDEQEKLIIKNSISPIPLHKALVLLDVLNEHNNSEYRNIERIAFAKQLVYSYSNLHFGPEVGVRSKKRMDASVVDLWLSQVNQMADDLDNVSSDIHAKCQVHLADARAIGNVLEPESINAIITSPPYPNEKDYSRTTRLESVLLGFINNKEDLRNNKKELLRSNTRNVYKNDDDEKWVINNDRIMSLSESIEKRRIELGKTSGFEKLYHKVVKLYFGGMARHLEELKPKLRSGAQLGYVVGDQASYFRILIPTGELLAEVAKDLGYEVTGIDLFRTRLSTATKQQLREEVVLLKWKG